MFDDRNISVGQKLADADLYGMPLQIIIGAKNLEKNIIEVKVRQTGEVIELGGDLNQEEFTKEINNIWQKVF